MYVQLTSLIISDLTRRSSSFVTIDIITEYLKTGNVTSLYIRQGSSQLDADIESMPDRNTFTSEICLDKLPKVSVPYMFLYNSRDSNVFRM